MVPGQIDELKDSLEAVNSTVMERIHDRLMDRLMGFLLNGKPLVDRPRLGSEIHLHAVGHAFSFPYLAGERYQMALRMGGSKVGREVGEHLMEAGLSHDEAIKRVINFLKYCKVGKVTAGETIKIEDNCESLYMKLSTLKLEEACCYFTTGFLNGLFSAVKNQRVSETKCVGLGDPYCEFKLVPGQIDELKDSLEAVDSTIMEKIHDRLIGRLMGFLLNGKPLVDRPSLGGEIQLHAVGHAFSFPYVAGERYQMALRMGGSKVGREVGEHLMEAGLSHDEAVQRVIDFLKYCKVGRITADETIKIENNCESYWMKLNTLKPEEACCYFTTGFLNGLFSAVKNQHVREIKCIATGDPYCEWEIV